MLIVALVTPLSSPAMPNSEQAITNSAGYETVLLKDLERQIIDGSNVTWLTTASKEAFLALYRANQSGQNKGSILILHDQGQHLNWPGLLQHLRTELPHHGWSTLSIALPPFSTHFAQGKETDNRDTYLSISLERLNRTMSFWQEITQPEQNNIFVVVLFGLSSHGWFLALQNTLAAPAITGYILIDGYQLLPSQPFNLTEMLFKQNIAILDWTQNTPHHVSQGEQRSIKAKQMGFKFHTQVPLPSTRPDNRQKDDLMLIRKKILHWLNKLLQ